MWPGADLKSTLNDYLKQLDYSTVRDLQELIKFNKDHAEQELPPRHDNQDFLVQTQAQNISAQHYRTQLDLMHSLFRENGVDAVMERYNVDVIIGPSDSFLSSIATFTGKASFAFKFHRLIISGYPIAQAPLSYLNFNGRPLGVSLLARAGQDAVLVQALSAWETTFGPRKPPPLLEESE